MSFSKAQDLLRLAQMAASRRGGVSLEDICTEFGVSHRTAQRMTEALEAAFANVTTMDAEDRRRYWRLDAPPPERLQPRQETTIEALEIAARTARDQARLLHARALEDLRDGLLARLTPRDATRSEADAEAVLAGLGQVMRPGPTVALRPDLTDAVMERKTSMIEVGNCDQEQTDPAFARPQQLADVEHSILCLRLLRIREHEEECAYLSHQAFTTAVPRTCPGSREALIEVRVRPLLPVFHLAKRPCLCPPMKTGSRAKCFP